MKKATGKRFWKKALAVLLTAGLSAGTLTGCGNSSVENKTQDGKTDGEVTITIWHDKEDAVTQVLEEEFAQLEPQIQVVLEKKSDLTEALKMVGNDPKAAPDMYFFAHDKIGVYAEMGILSPITDIIPAEELDAYMDNTIEAATYKGTVYQLPIYYETLLFMYNRLYM